MVTPVLARSSRFRRPDWTNGGVPAPSGGWSAPITISAAIAHQQREPGTAAPPRHDAAPSRILEIGTFVFGPTEVFARARCPIPQSS